MFIFIKQEWKYWLKTPMFYVFLIINTLMIFGASSSDSIQIGGGVGSTFKNAPFVVENFYGFMSLICLMMTTAFMNASAGRDFQHNMYQLVFTSPIKKYNYFFGKFIGAFTIAVLPLIGISIGVLLAKYMPWVEPERYGPTVWAGHFWGLVGFAIPNVFIQGVVLFSLAMIFRNNIVSFVGAMGILILYVISSGYTADIKNEWLANILDPFGFQPFDTLTKYMTIDEKNTTAVPLVGQFLWNRLLWVGIALAGLFALYFRFSFNVKNKTSSKIKKVIEEKEPSITATNFVPSVANKFSFSQLFSLSKFEFKSIVKNPTFIIIMMIGAINLIASLTSFTGRYGASEYPVTYSIIERILGAFALFSIGFITFYTGVLVWKERDEKFNEIQDASAVKTSMLFISKFIAVIAALVIVQLLLIGIGLITQMAFGFTDFKIGMYVKYLLGYMMLSYSFLVVIALLFHHLINNRYIAYFAFITFVILNGFLWNALKISTRLVKYGSTGDYNLSDMNGFGPFGDSIKWFQLYWVFGALILLFVAYAYMVRGKEDGFKKRSSIAWSILSKNKLALGLIAIGFVVTGSWIYYNTLVLNPLSNAKESEQESKNYELKYKKYQGAAQPILYKSEYKVDIFPNERNLNVHGENWVKNLESKPINELYFTLPQLNDSLVINIPNGSISMRDDKHGFRIYTLQKPMMPGDSMLIKFDNILIQKGFKNTVDFTKITSNGSFFDITDIAPFSGYIDMFEINDKNKRKELGLPKHLGKTKLSNDSIKRINPYISQNANWIEQTITVSTISDQTAIAPGSLIKSWEEKGRKYFTYKLDKVALNFFAIMSAKYEVQRKKWNGVDIEVYYDKQHAVNVPNMLRSIEKSLDYYTKNFGPYYHKQARIIEFPKYAGFAQAFPGTMPYSESIGFITDLRDVKKDDIDFVYYVVAHEMAHQYWAHQIIGPDMQGSEWFSEGFAQYSALMVMEKEYGKDKMKKFLEYEMNGYLEGRSSEANAERPISKTEGQGYIHYQKASVAMYYLKEMIGEQKVNQALRTLIEKFAYKQPPYPTALMVLDEVRKVTPDSLQYIVTDLFENITLFDNRIKEASSKKVGNEYEVTISTFSNKFYADSLGKEKEIAINDYIDIGVFGNAEKKDDVGKPLYMQRVKINKKDNSFTIRTKEQPLKVGIDPYNYLVDRIPNDNIKPVKD